MATFYIVSIILTVLSLLGSLFGGDLDGDVDVDLNAELDDLGDVDSPRVFSLRTISAGLLAFSIGGGIMYYNGYGLGVQMLTGIPSALAFGVIMWYVTKFIYSMQSSTDVTMKSLIGKTATVTIGTSKTGTSQVKIDTSNGAKEFIVKEKNNRKLKVTDEVKLSERLGNMFVVEKQ